MRNKVPLSMNIIPSNIEGYERYITIYYDLAYVNKKTGKWYRRPGVSEDLERLGWEAPPITKMGSEFILHTERDYEIMFSEFIEKGDNDE